jgi:hypothetical protein
MLHVTNGSIVLERIHDLGVGGEVIPWDDVLHDGPVPGGVSEPELRRLRASFLANGRPDRAGEIERSLEARDRALEQGASSGQEVVLWFEHDLYDQLQLLQVLDRLSQITDYVTVVLANDYLSAQSDATLQTWFAARSRLSPGEWAAASDAWRAFTAADPTAIDAPRPGAWPSLTSSFRRHLQQYPSLRTGLSRTEAQTLRALASPDTPRKVYMAANHSVEEAVFLGDWGWWAHITQLFTCDRPLLRVDGPLGAPLDRADWWLGDDDRPSIALTADGARAAAGELDHVAVNGLDRWLGGVHLRGHGPMWRWNDAAEVVEYR